MTPTSSRVWGWKKSSKTNVMFILLVIYDHILSKDSTLVFISTYIHIFVLPVIFLTKFLNEIFPKKKIN